MNLDFKKMAERTARLFFRPEEKLYPRLCEQVQRDLEVVAHEFTHMIARLGDNHEFHAFIIVEGDGVPFRNVYTSEKTAKKALTHIPFIGPARVVKVTWGKEV